MRRFAVLLALVVAVGATTYGTGEHVWEQAHKDKAVEVHNKWRCAHTEHASDTPIMSWSDKLGQKAQCWAKQMASENAMYHSNSKQCCFADSGDCGYGENILYYGGFSSVTSDQLLEKIQSYFQMWYNEVADYAPNNPGFSGGTGHFTQVVWQNSLSLGCGSAGSSSGKLFMACSYYRAGNYGGQFPANVLCSNSDGKPCIPWRSPDSCDVNQFYDAGAIQWSPITPGDSSSNALLIAKGTAVHVVSPHAVKVVHTLTHDGSTPSEPSCSNSPSHSGNFDDFYFQQDDNGNALQPGETVIIKVKGCAASPHDHSATFTGYFKIDQPKAPDAAVFTPTGAAKIARNSHVVAKSSGAEKVCYTIDNSAPTCTQSSQCEAHNYVDVIVDHDETLKVIGCVQAADGSSWLTSPVKAETYEIETVDHRCDSAFQGNWASMMDWACSGGCGRYLLAKYNAQYDYCSACKGAFHSSVAEAEAANPGWFVFDHDGLRCSEFGKATGCTLVGGAAADTSDAAGTSAVQWTTTTTVVLVVGLVAMVAFFVVGVVVGKRTMTARRQGVKEDTSAQLENLVDEQEL